MEFSRAFRGLHPIAEAFLQMVTRRFVVTGMVQGVGFRAALRDEARRHGLSGWVRNRREGSVEALAQGDGEAVEKLLAWAGHGPRGAQVTALRLLTATAEDAAPLAAFEIRPTA